jgi:hypothetical protein
MNNIIILFTALTVFALKYVFLLFDGPGKGWFPFSKQILSKAAYIDYLCTDLGYLVICVTIYFVSGKSNLSLLLLIIAIGYVIDYLLIYNEPFAHYKGIGVSYSLLAGMVLAAILFYEIITKLWFS